MRMPTNSATHGTLWHRRAAWMYGVSLSAIVALSGCSSSLGEAVSVAADASGSEASLSALRATVGDGMSVDYNIIESNDELAELVDSVLVGEVAGIQDGPVFGHADDDLTDIHSVVIRVRATEVIKGDLAVGESALVLMYAPDGVDARVWSEALPEGERVVVYASVGKLKETSGSYGPIDASVGVPDGADVYTPAVQGFAVQVSDDTIYWPLTDLKRSGSLKEALPGGAAVGNLLEGEEDEEAPEG